jgi:hypothetical protein
MGRTWETSEMHTGLFVGKVRESLLGGVSIDRRMIDRDRTGD